MALITCLECGQENQLDACYCDYCGIQLASALEGQLFEQQNKQQPIVMNEQSQVDFDDNQKGNAFFSEIKIDQNAKPFQEISVYPATVLDTKENQIFSEQNLLATPRAFLKHEITKRVFKLPQYNTLIYLGKPNSEISIHVDLSTLPNADIISRVHASIYIEKNLFYLEDAGSLNGTALNGESLRPGVRFRKILRNGDLIALGRVRKVNLLFLIDS